MEEENKPEPAGDWGVEVPAPGESYEDEGTFPRMPDGATRKEQILNKIQELRLNADMKITTYQAVWFVSTDDSKHYVFGQLAAKKRDPEAAEEWNDEEEGRVPIPDHPNMQVTLETCYNPHGRSSITLELTYPSINKPLRKYNRMYLKLDPSNHLLKATSETGQSVLITPLSSLEDEDKEQVGSWFRLTKEQLSKDIHHVNIMFRQREDITFPLDINVFTDAFYKGGTIFSTEQAHAIATEVKSAGVIRLLIRDNYDTLHTSIMEVADHISLQCEEEYRSGEPYFKDTMVKWNDKHAIGQNDNQFLSVESMPWHEYTRQIAFYSIRDYFYVTKVGFKYEMEILKATYEESFQVKARIVKLVNPPSQKTDDVYTLLFVQFDQDQPPFPFRRFDTVKLQWRGIDEEDFAPPEVQGAVLSPLSIGYQTDIPVLIRRSISEIRYGRQEEVTDDESVPTTSISFPEPMWTTLETEQLTVAEARRAIVDLPSVPFYLRYRYSSNNVEKVSKALNLFEGNLSNQRIANRLRERMAYDLNNLSVWNYLNQLSSQDNLVMKNNKVVTKSDFVDAILKDRLRPNQIALLNSMKNIKGHRLLIVGPGGTGKTVGALLAVQPFFAVDKRILITANSNALCESIMEMLINEGKKTMALLHPNKPFVVIRVHPSATDKQASMGTKDDDMVLTELQPEDTHFWEQYEVGRAIRGDVVRQVKPPTSYSYDHRFKHYENTIPYWFGMLEKRPLYKDVIGQFRQSLEAYHENKSIKTKDILTLNYNKACELVFKEAHAVVCTTSVALEPTVYMKFSPSIRIMDEATQVPEAIDAALDATCCAELVIYIGDIKQFINYFETTSGSNPCAANLNYPTLVRLMDAGYTVCPFIHQQRFVSQIGKLVSRHSYKNGLVVNDAMDKTTKANKARSAIQMIAKVHRSNIAVLNVQNTTSSRIAGSMINAGTLTVAFNTMASLFEKGGYKPGEIGYLTPYLGQLNIARRAFAAKFATHDVDKMMLSTIDASQGCDADFIVLDYPMTKTIGFVEAKARVTIAMTRAKYGLVLVADLQELTNAKKYEKSSLKKYIDDVAYRKTRQVIFEEPHEDIVPFLPSDDYERAPVT